MRDFIFPIQELFSRPYQYLAIRHNMLTKLTRKCKQQKADELVIDMYMNQSCKSTSSMPYSAKAFIPHLKDSR